MSKVYVCIVIITTSFYTCTYVYPQEAIGIQKQQITNKAMHVEPGNVTVNFKGADIRAVLNYLSEVSGVDIVPSPDVSGTVTLKLTNKPWKVALDIIVKNYGYAYEREGNIIRIVTVESLRLEELSTEVIPLNYSNAKEAYVTVKDMLTERGKATFGERTNVLVVTDLPTNIYKIKGIIEQIDKKTPQVMIEARIFETLLEKDEKMGIDWTLKIAATGARRPTTIPFEASGPISFLGPEMSKFLPVGQTGATTVEEGAGGAGTTAVTGTGGFPIDDAGVVKFPFINSNLFTYGTLDFSEFQVVLELLKSRRRTEVISNPRITTLNNKQAKILVGRVYNFPTFTQVEETGRWVISGYTARELGIRLLVTPHVNDKGEVVVELKPEISDYLGLEQISEELSAPIWSTRLAQTQVMVRDGETIFIGGLIKESNIDLEKKIPLIGDLFGDVPFLGNLVKHKAQDKEKTELVFFITVYIVKNVRDLAAVASRDIEQVQLFQELTGATEETAAKNNEVIVDLPIPGSKKAEEERKPLFDFRKKEKQEQTKTK